VSEESVERDVEDAIGCIVEEEAEVVETSFGLNVQAHHSRLSKFHKKILIENDESRSRTRELIVERMEGEDRGTTQAGREGPCPG